MRDGKQARLMALLVSSAYLNFIVAGVSPRGGDQRAMKTDEVRDRPLETFGVHTPILEFYRKFLVSVPFVH